MYLEICTLGYNVILFPHPIPLPLNVESDNFIKQIIFRKVPGRGAPSGGRGSSEKVFPVMATPLRVELSEIESLHRGITASRGSSGEVSPGRGAPAGDGAVWQ